MRWGLYGRNRSLGASSSGVYLLQHLCIPLTCFPSTLRWRCFSSVYFHLSHSSQVLWFQQWEKKVYAHFPKYFSLFPKITILCVCSPIMKIKLMLTNSASWSVGLILILPTSASNAIYSKTKSWLNCPISLVSYSLHLDSSFKLYFFFFILSWWWWGLSLEPPECWISTLPLSAFQP